MDSKQVIARFEAERQALALMDHPNIARVLDAGTTGTGRPFFVMDLVKGVPITTYCDEHHLTPRQRLELFLPICQAVQHAHQKGVIHRDLKPSNVLVALYDGRPVPKVIDFGVAKAIAQPLTEKTLVTGFGTLVGTLEYMSPEQVEVNQLDIDTRSDIYALGVLLYKLLTGTTPFTRPDLEKGGVLEMLRVIREQDPRRPSTKLSTAEGLPTLAANRGIEPAKLIKLIRGELDWIVMKALEKDRGRRYETANGLAMDVQRYLADEPVLAGPPSAWYRFRKFVWRNKGPVMAASLVGLALVGGVIGTTFGLLRAEQRAEGELRTREELQRRLAQIEKTAETLAYVFRDLDPEAAEKEGVTSRALLCRRMVEAAQHLEDEAIGNPPMVARLQHVLGISLRELGQLQQAEGMLLKACRTREQVLGAYHLDTIATKHHLAVLYRAKGMYNQAQMLCEEVLNIRVAQLGSGHPDTLATQLTLAAVNHNQGNYDRAETLYKQVLETRAAQGGANHPDTLYAKYRLAMLYRTLGKYDTAERLYKEVLAVRTALLGAGNLNTVATMHQLAALYMSQGNYDLAESLYKDVLAVRTAKLGTEHPDTLTTRHHVAFLHEARANYAVAETMHHEVLKARTAVLGPDHPDTLSSMAGLGTHYRLRGQYGQAEPLLQEAVARARVTLTICNPATQRFMRDLALLHEQQGKSHVAEPLRRELAAFLCGSAGPESSLYADELDWLAENLGAQQKFAQAESVARESLAIRQKNDLEHWSSFNTQLLVGSTLLGQKNYAEAEPLLLQGYVGMKDREAQIPAAARGCLSEGLQNLVRLYDAWGKPDKAAKWRKEVQALGQAGATPVEPKDK